MHNHVQGNCKTSDEQGLASFMAPRFFTRPRSIMKFPIDDIDGLDLTVIKKSHKNGRITRMISFPKGNSLCYDSNGSIFLQHTVSR